MKKFVTLTAIALAGATMGVGSTFGWWADGTDDDVEKTKTKSADKVEVNLELTPTKVEVVEDVLKQVEQVDVLQPVEGEIRLETVVATEGGEKEVLDQPRKT